MWCALTFIVATTAYAGPPEASHAEIAAWRPPATELAAERWSPVMRRGRAQSTTDEQPRGTARRSRNLLLGALVAEGAAAALLGAASATRSSYLASDEPTRGMYRTNRILGHAGYASGVGGVALALGAVSLGEW
jgi:hypothetical protein